MTLIPTAARVLLETKIRNAAKEYYVDSAPTISDSQFDTLVDELREIDPENIVLTLTGWGLESKADDPDFFKHLIPVTGLGEVKFKDMISDESVGCYGYGIKLDGITGVCYYEDGNLQRVLTRYDHEYGKDITKAAILTGKVPTRIPYTGKVQVRGEFFLTFEDFESMIKAGLCKEDTHPRNVASGAMMGSDPAKQSFVSFRAFVVYGDAFAGVDIYQATRDLEGCTDFDVVIPSIKIHTLEDMQAYYDEEYKKQPIDGLVRTPIFDPGEAGPSPMVGETGVYDQQKIKFPAKVTGRTKIIGVEMRTTRTGRIIPHGKLEPVFIDGCWMRNVTLNNVEWIRNRFENKPIWVGAEVELQRANGIIPNIIEVHVPATVPSNNYLAYLAGWPADQVVQDEDENGNKASDLRLDSCDWFKTASMWRVIELGMEKGQGGAAMDQVFQDFYTSIQGGKIERDVAKLDWDLSDFVAWIATEDVSECDPRTQIISSNIQGRTSLNTILLDDLTWVLNVPGWGDSKRAEMMRKLVSEMPAFVESDEGRASNFVYGWLVHNIESKHHKTIVGDLFEVLHFDASLPDWALLKSDEDIAAEEAAAATKVKFSMTGKISGFKKQELADRVAEVAIWDDTSPEVLVTDADRESAKMKKARESGIPVMTSADFISKYTK